MFTVKTPPRGEDPFGSGEFQAPRGTRKHKGIDYTVAAETEIPTLVKGKVTKLGVAYTRTPKFRYVEVTDSKKNRHRYFYVKPTVKEGDLVNVGDIIGTAQDISGYHSTKQAQMKNHIHYEILAKTGKPINPEKYHS